MNTVCLIPARGGSKRLPRKNAVDFLGKPIISYTIGAALRSGLFTRVVVSTDDGEIGELAVRFGATGQVRPANLAGDRATVVDVCVQFLESEEADGRSYDALCCLLATSPMRDEHDIKAVLDLIEPGQCDFAMAVTTYDVPPYQALRVDERGYLVPVWPDVLDTRSQDLPVPYVDNGSTYCMSVPALRRWRTFYGPTLRGHVMPRERSVDIDEPTDLEMARYFAQLRLK
jgi:pseudaminic acid cytidylyltransferase